MNKVIFPKKIVKAKGNGDFKKLLSKKEVQIGLNEQSLTAMENGDYVILDFGKEYAGGLRILTFSVGGEGKAKIRLGESVSEVLHGVGECGATNDHATRDLTVKLENYSDMTFCNSGFRFARVEIPEGSSAQIKSILLKSDVFEKPFTGSFRCDDKLVNDIFRTAAYTVRLCLQNGMIWDGIKRDRLVWIGDIYPEMRSVTSLFGRLGNIDRSLNFVRDETPLPGWMNNISTYSFWWIVILKDYFLYNGDMKYLGEQREYLKALLDQIDSCVAEDGTLLFTGYLIDWPTHYVDPADGEDRRLDEIAGVHALALMAANAAEYLFGVLGEDGTKAANLKAKLLKKTYSVRKYKQISALRVYAGIGTKDDERLLLEGGAHGMSTFMSYFILQGLAENGKHAEALSVMKEFYGGMLSLGATTFWEDFDIDWLKNAGRIDKMPKKGQVDVHAAYGAFCYKGLRHSFCHGWSSGVVAYLVQSVAGIEVLDAGCKKIAIRPHLDGLTSVDVVFPTPYGKLKVSHRKNEKGEIETTIDAPQGIEIVR